MKWCLMSTSVFQSVCDEIVGNGWEKNGIGTIGEKTLHAVLKHYYAPTDALHEVKIGSFVADIISDNCVIEIQTRAFNRLRRKLEVFLESFQVMVVYPIPQTKWLLWIDESTGETSRKRKSPKQGSIHDAIAELYRVKSFLRHPNFKLCIALIDMEEYRYLNGWSADRKKGSTRYDRVPIDLISEVFFDTVHDYLHFIPESLADGFTSKEYSKETRTTLRVSQTALNVLHYLGVVKRVGKRGRSFIYERTG